MANTTNPLITQLYIFQVWQLSSYELSVNFIRTTFLETYSLVRGNNRKWIHCKLPQDPRSYFYARKIFHYAFPSLINFWTSAVNNELSRTKITNWYFTLYAKLSILLPKRYVIKKGINFFFRFWVSLWRMKRRCFRLPSKNSLNQELNWQEQ